MLKTFFKRYAVAIIACTSAAVFLLISFAILTPSQAAAVAQEGEPIERMGDIFLALATLFGLYMIFVKKEFTWRFYPVFMFFALLRELGFHNSYTTMSVFKSRFYVSPDVPFYEKIIGAAVVFILLYSVFRISKYFIPTVIKAFKGETYALLVYTAMGMSGLAKFLDGFFRKFPSFRVHAETIGGYMVYAEESLETISYLLFLLAPMAYLRYKKRQQK